MLNLGDTYRHGTGTHLRVIISDPAKFPDELVVVNMSSQRSWQDQSCVLHSSDHPFIDHETVIYYQKAMVHTAKQIHEFFTRGSIQFEECASAELLAKILKGAELSDRLPIGIRSILETQGAIPTT